MEINIVELKSVLLRALSSLLVLFLVTKILGKKQVSQLSLFDYVIGISIGNFAAEMTINLESKEFYGIIAVIIFGLIAYLVSVLTMKSIKLRRFFMGTPTILIQNGKILDNNFHKVKYDINDMLEQCRIKGYYDVSNIEYAIVEANGELSVLPKEDKRPITPSDMQLNVKKEGLCANVIIDGKVMIKNLNLINKDEDWLYHELKIKGINLNDVLLATVDVNNKLVLYERNKNIQDLTILE